MTVELITWEELVSSLESTGASFLPGLASHVTVNDELYLLLRVKLSMGDYLDYTFSPTRVVVGLGCRTCGRDLWFLDPLGGTNPDRVICTFCSHELKSTVRGNPHRMVEFGTDSTGFFASPQASEIDLFAHALTERGEHNLAAALTLAQVAMLAYEQLSLEWLMGLPVLSLPSDHPLVPRSNLH